MVVLHVQRNYLHNTRSLHVSCCFTKCRCFKKNHKIDNSPIGVEADDHLQIYLVICSFGFGVFSVYRITLKDGHSRMNDNEFISRKVVLDR